MAPITRRWLCLLGGMTAFLVAGGSASIAQNMVSLSGPGPVGCGHEHHLSRPGGALCRAAGHMKESLKSRLIGYPEYFIEPPLGASLQQNLGVMTAHAEQHNYFLYRSDFVAGSTTLTPNGARRLTTMANRMDCWLGPMVIEWVPDQPGLAESRRDAILAMIQQSQLPIPPERFLIGPTPYLGINGDEAAQNFAIYLNRAQRAPGAYLLTPNIPYDVNVLSGTGTGGRGAQ